MINREVVEEGTRLLATAIAEILEDVHSDAAFDDDTTDRCRIVNLATAGRDVSALAAAMEVLTRRVEHAAHNDLKAAAGA